jgi:hypothetical protein
MISDTRKILTSQELNAEISELRRKLAGLEDLRHRCPGTRAEWDEGIILVHGDFFLEFIKNKAAEEIDLDSWPAKHINWDKAVVERMKRYDFIQYVGAIYWIIDD